MLSLFERLFHKEDIKIQEEKFALARSLEEGYSNRFYINERIRSTYIKIDEQNERNVLYLIGQKKLMGWDYMTTSFISTLLDEARIVRGNIELWKTEPYPHAWIEVNIDGLTYCFDPCFDLIILRSDYNKIFKPDVKVRINAALAKEKLIEYLQNASKNGAFIKGTKDLNDVFCETNALVTGKIENNKIKSLNIKFYYD